jgi:GRAM domain
VLQFYLKSCFAFSFFQLTIRCKDIVRVTKERTAKVIPNAIQICTKDDRYFFTSFGARDKTFLILDRVWKSSINNLVRDLISFPSSFLAWLLVFCPEMNT